MKFVSFREFLKEQEDVVLVTDQNKDDRTVKSFVKDYINNPSIELKDNGVLITGKTKKIVYKDVVLVTDQNKDDRTVKSFVKDYINNPSIELKDNGVLITGKTKKIVYKDIDTSLATPNITIGTNRIIRKIIDDVVSKMLEQGITKLMNITSDVVDVVVDVDERNSSFVFKSRFETIDYRGEIEIVLDLERSGKLITMCDITINVNWNKK